jgi:hypothetical protein
MPLINYFILLERAVSSHGREILYERIANAPELGLVYYYPAMG